MPHVKSHGQVKTPSGNHSRKEVKSTGKSRARDSLHSAYGGDENAKNPFAEVKDKRIPESSEKIPVT